MTTSYDKIDDILLVCDEITNSKVLRLIEIGMHKIYLQSQASLERIYRA